MRVVVVVTSMLFCGPVFAQGVKLPSVTNSVEIRTWTDDTGRHKRQAVFVRRDGDTIVLQLKDGRDISVKYDRLSEVDRAFVDATRAQKNPGRPSFRELLARQTTKQLPPTGLSDVELEGATLLGKRVEKAVSDGVDQVVALFDIDQFAKRTIEGIELPPEGVTAFTALAPNSLKQIVSAIIANTQRGFGPLRFIRGRRVETSKRLLFRTVHETSGLVAYYEFIYESPVSGRPPLQDIWIFNAGETSSNSLRRGNIMLAGAINQSFVSKLVAGEADIVKHIGEINQMCELHKQGKINEAIAALKTLPDSVRKDKTYLLMLINCADQARNQQEFTAAVRDYERIFPRDPSLAFVRLASAASGNDKVLFMDTVDKIDAAVGGDSILLCLRGSWLADKLQENAAARSCFLQAIAMDPASPAVVACLLLHDLDVGAYAEVVDILTYGEEECGIDAGKLVSAYGKKCEGFLASTEGKKWKASQRASAQ